MLIYNSSESGHPCPFPDYRENACRFSPLFAVCLLYMDFIMLKYVHSMPTLWHTQSCLTLCDPMDCSSWSSPSQHTGVDSLSLLQGIFLTQESNPGLVHCRRTLYQLSLKGSPLSGDF